MAWTVVDEYTAGRAREADLKAATGDPLIVSRRVPLKAGAIAVRNVINWPASHRKNFTIGLPLSTEVFYEPFEVVFTLRFAVEYVEQIAHGRCAHSFKRLGHIRQHIDLRPRLNPAVTEKTDP